MTRRTRPVSMRSWRVLEDLPVLETDRLVLRRMTLNDAEAVFAYASDPEVTRYVLWETHHSILYKGDHRFVGTCGIVSWEPDHARAEIGYTLSRDYWGRGLASEAVRAMISFWFGRIALNRLEARCIADKTASCKRPG